MDNRYLLLWLEGPLQSWGFDSKFNRRDTLDFPTKSGVLGLILCALGASGEQRELLANLADLPHTCYRYDWGTNSTVQINSLLHDFQMIGSGYDDKDAWQKNLIPKTSEGKPAVGGGTKLTHRYYLQDVAFGVIVAVPESLAEKISDALENPAYPLYLGRRSCIPSEFIFHGNFLSLSDAEVALGKFVDAKNESQNNQKRCLIKTAKLIEGRLTDSSNNLALVSSFILNDVPVQFGPNKLYRDREVTKIKFN